MTAVTNYQKIADLAVAALDWEVDFTPKPGLVDAISNGAHRDMDAALFHRSAASLHDYFVQLGAVAEGRAPNDLLREQIGSLGRTAEKRMFAATNGVNTHKGAIWALGLLVTAYWLQPAANSAQLLAIAGQLARIDDPGNESVTKQTYGQQAQHQYGIGGAQAEAQSNFPHIARLLELPLTTKDDWLRALLTLYATVDDTNVIHRSDLATLRFLQQQAKRIAQASEPVLKNSEFAGLADFTIEKNISPGGSADLFAATKFLKTLPKQDLAERSVLDYGKITFQL